MQIATPKFSLHLSFQGDKAWQGALKHLFLNFHQQGHEVSYPVSMHITVFSIAEISLKLYISKRNKSNNHRKKNSMNAQRLSITNVKKTIGTYFKHSVRRSGYNKSAYCCVFADSILLCGSGQQSRGCTNE